jgi:hypothetical protein
VTKRRRPTEMPKAQVIGPCKETQGGDVAEAVGLIERGVTDEQIKHMVYRFLGWRLPEHFRPDAGISFNPEYNVEFNAARGKPPALHQPTGTNLFGAEQAEAMVRYIIEGLPGNTEAKQ